MEDDRPAAPEDLRSFEAAYEELSGLVTQLESGALTLDAGLEAYERGVGSLKRCYRILDQAERRLELLVQDAQGRPQTRTTDLAAIRREPKAAAAVAHAAVGVQPATPAPTPSPDAVQREEPVPAPAPAPAPTPPRRRTAPKKKPRPPTDERGLF